MNQLHRATTVILASYDLGVIRTIADRVMPAQGLVVEQGSTGSSRIHSTPVPSSPPTCSMIPKVNPFSGKIMLKT
ncbi:hypothetical protein [Mesorhizobium sangaii]|uniref:ABC-type glutathione transport system ATPase component n=1 Tax=Mesorhizobium sangaii TaxID=505389 RepID=A0A841P844_9HYPH|nr:hypothetical protein [Mesorhizobium sangaii]MBB6411474.1 ABC-type glutathione transport system ATPase component [Mesorhizobium sangaii]